MSSHAAANFEINIFLLFHELLIYYLKKNYWREDYSNSIVIMADQATNEDMEVVADEQKPLEIGGFSSMEEFTNVSY